MKPASSIILFTVLSGVGFGIFFWLGLPFYTNNARINTLLFSLAFLFSLSGLIASSFHLGNPQRALKAFSQWRSSWLSREAVLAVVTLALNFLQAILLIIFETNYFWLGVLCSIFSVATIFATSMIYTQMRTVPRWNIYLTPILFILYAITGTSIFFNGINYTFLLVCFLGITQILTWRVGDKKFRSISHIGTATGLSSKRGVVRMLEPPHTGTNYLLKEMVFIVGQKHIHKLRWITLILSIFLPALTILICFIHHTNSETIIALIFVFNLLGTFVSRWLFFSEAEHVVGLYYDR